MNTLSYQQARDKIIDAYFKDEIKPFNPDFCFCGTLQGGRWWVMKQYVKNYSYEEYGRMEVALFSYFPCLVWIQNGLLDGNEKDVKNDKGYEDKLFKGMSAAIEVLEDIHRSRGEDVDELPKLIKRQKVTTPMLANQVKRDG